MSGLHAALRDLGLCVAPAWADACAEGIPPGEGQLQRAIARFLTSDLNVIGSGCLPPDLPVRSPVEVGLHTTIFPHSTCLVSIDCLEEDR